MQKRHCADSVHGQCIVDRFGQVWAVSTSLHGLPPNFTHALKFCLERFLSPFQSARLIGSGGNSPSSRFSWRKVWTGVNWCEVQLLFGAAPQPIRRWKAPDSPSSNVKFHQDTTQDKKVMAFNNSGTKAVACDHPQKGVSYHLSSPELDKPYVVGKLSISEA